MTEVVTMPAEGAAAPIDLDGLRSWIGREENRLDTVSPAALSGLAMTLDRPQASDSELQLPPLGHWLLFHPVARQSELGQDGHPALGGFLPPIPLPRRMWAGGRLRFHAPISVGDVVSRSTRIANLTAKRGRQGDLVFVTLLHRINGPAGLAVEEEQDLVYRALSRPSGEAPGEDALPARWSETIVPDSTLLFRYSALTFNAHRIHYDLPYARETEHYPDLVVQGPLTATLLMDRAVRWLGQMPTAFSFRGISPLYASRPLTLNGSSSDGVVRLWAADDQNRVAMTAEATFSQPR